MERENGSQATDRLIDLLEVLADSPQPMSTSDLALALGLHRSIVHRYLQTLQRRNVVRRLADARYTLGFELVLLASAVSHDFQSIAQAELAGLADVLCCTSFLAAADEDNKETRCLLYAEPRHAEVRLSVRLGYLGRGPHSGQNALAAAIASGQPPQNDDAKLVKDARRKGYAETRSQVLEGISLVAAPITTAPGYSSACVAVLYPIGRPKRASIGEAVIATAQTLSEYFLRGVIELPMPSELGTSTSAHLKGALDSARATSRSRPRRPSQR